MVSTCSKFYQALCLHLLLAHLTGGQQFEDAATKDLRIGQNQNEFKFLSIGRGCKETSSQQGTNSSRVQVQRVYFIMLAVHNALQGIKEQIIGKDELQGVQWGSLEWFSAFEALFSSEVGQPYFASNDSPLYYVWRQTAETVQPICFSKRLTQQFCPGGQYFEMVDWQQSVVLNIVVRAAYYLVVAVCSKESSRTWVARGCQGEKPSSDVQFVIHPVFANPITNTLRPSKDKLQCGYPTISFVLQDMDYSTQAMILDEEDQSYCVALMAYPIQLPKRFLSQPLICEQGGQGSQELQEMMAMKSVAQQIQSKTQTREDLEEFVSAESYVSLHSQVENPNRGRSVQTQMVKLFRGYVAFPQLNMAMQHGQTDRQLQKTVTKKIRMHAADSQGLAEVYVATAKLLGKQDEKKVRRGGILRRQHSKHSSLLQDHQNRGQPKCNLRQITFNCSLHIMQLPVDELISQLLQTME
eukprot:TRINITY_DN9442_c0_g2_i6.p1 TRINITY_DN9442_c0_g2~~TRINITY_DN9442_c0_g2_i6.p1  ORF type:complete len:486 (+),score=23.55 TRINITY_DN9442_c0_g2_i6:56-1459(+)